MLFDIAYKKLILFNIYNSLKKYEKFPYSYISKLQDNSFFQRDRKFLEFRDNQKAKLDFYKCSIIANAYDIKHYRKLVIEKVKNQLKYIPDKNIYRFLNKRIHYRDISILSILKILNKSQKLSITAYKKAKKNYNLSNLNIKLIKILKNTYKLPLCYSIKGIMPIYYLEIKPLSTHTKGLIAQYLRTVKTHTSKSSLFALDKIRINSKRQYTILKFKNQNYKVIFKKSYSNLKCFNPTSLRVFEEFKIRVKNSYLPQIPPKLII